MKPRLTPTGQEVSFPPDELIVSKTDLSGRITYVNRVFMKVCNYPEEALLGVQHNIVRHPDMPRGAFRLMWDTLKGGHEFFGIVKNMTAQGHHYWVFANVTIDRRQGHPVGYFSVRRQAPTQAIAAGALIGPAQVAARMLEAGPLRHLHPLTSGRLATTTP